MKKPIIVGWVYCDKLTGQPLSSHAQHFYIRATCPTSHQLMAYGHQRGAKVISRKVEVRFIEEAR